jgi:hypothetical protein
MDHISVLALLIVLVLFLIYNKQKEQFSNRKQQYFNYSNLLSKSSPKWVQTNKTLDEIEYILLEIITLINKETNKNFFVGNIDNITKDKLEDGAIHYLIDLFLFEKTDNITIRLIIDFTIDKENNVVVNTITKSNANKYDYDAISSKPYHFEDCITDKRNQTKQIHIKGFNEISLPHALYDGNVSKTVPTIPEFNKDILPAILEKDINYNNLKEKKLKRNNLKKKYDRYSILIDEKNKNYDYFPHYEENELLKLQPKFNSSIHKNSSDKTGNSWLFSPTRVEINHNY